MALFLHKDKIQRSNSEQTWLWLNTPHTGKQIHNIVNGFTASRKKTKSDHSLVPQSSLGSLPIENDVSCHSVWARNFLQNFVSVMATVLRSVSTFLVFEMTTNDITWPNYSKNYNTEQTHHNFKSFLHI